MTAELRILHELLRSCSRKNPCGLEGSTSFRCPRLVTIQRVQSGSMMSVPVGFWGHSIKLKFQATRVTDVLKELRRSLLRYLSLYALSAHAETALSLRIGR